MNYQAHLLDADDIRKRLWPDLGFSRHDREENIRRLGVVAQLLTDNGAIAIVAAVSSYRSARDNIRHGSFNFFEVYVNAPLALCEQRDVKGMYRMARAGQLPGFTGIDDPYEPPLDPEVECLTKFESPTESVTKIITKLQGF